MSSSVDPVWVLFRRRTFARLAYWLQVLGFNSRDRSLSNHIYFLYFLGFWLLWWIAICAMLGAGLTRVFAFFPDTPPTALMVLFGGLVLAVLGLLNLWQVAGRSPFVFSEADAYLLCQTPASRRNVGLAWLLMDWLGTAFFFVVGIVTISIALTDVAWSGAVSFLTLPAYFISSLRALLIVMPLQLGLQAGIYGVGALRLRRDRLPKRMVGLRRVITLVSLGLIVSTFLPHGVSMFLAPLTFPLQAAFGAFVSISDWFIRACVSLLVLGLGLTGLLIWANRIHLGWAAQETRLESVIRLARSVMDYEFLEIVHGQTKMASTHAPSRLPAKPDIWILLWKNMIQSRRALRLSQVVRWIFMLPLGMSIFLAPTWTTQLLMGSIWAVSLGNLITERLRKDLAHWWLLRSLPFQNVHLLLALLAPAWAGGVVLGWLALALTSPVMPFGWLAAIVLPFLAACAGLGSASDILDNAKARVLMAPSLAEENVPKPELQGAVMILISVGLPLGLLILSSIRAGTLWWGALSLPLSFLMTVFLFRATLTRYAWME